jgi:hypothetical protein
VINKRQQETDFKNHVRYRDNLRKQYQMEGAPATAGLMNMRTNQQL